ncbi:hypothetical protein B0H11DRAFT_563389 [Mycena galericulata]|nr:hypothetical protein B0H11DRAFT_563389 [Mycena galericulata]
MPACFTTSKLPELSLQPTTAMVDCEISARLLFISTGCASLTTALTHFFLSFTKRGGPALFHLPQLAQMNVSALLVTCMLITIGHRLLCSALASRSQQDPNAARLGPVTAAISLTTADKDFKHKDKNSFQGVRGFSSALEAPPTSQIPVFRSTLPVPGHACQQYLRL